MLRHSKLRALAFVCLVAAGAAGAQDSPLTGDRIRELIVGNTVIGPFRARLYDFSYTAEGEVYGGIGVDVDSGTWRIEGDNTYCHEWFTHFGGVERCYQWYRHDPRSNSLGELQMKNVDAFRVDDIWIWRITPGLQR